MPPKLPRSMAAPHHSHEWYVAILLGIAAAAWEAGWVVLSLAGAKPRGQLPQAFTRVTAALHLAITNHPIPIGWPRVLWDMRPVSPLAVVLVCLGLSLAVAMVIRTFLRFVEFGPGPGRGGGGGGGGGGGPAGQPAPAVDRSLDQWLAGVAAGEDE